jgi:hypothetical protein
LYAGECCVAHFCFYDSHKLRLLSTAPKVENVWLSQSNSCSSPATPKTRGLSEAAISQRFGLKLCKAFWGFGLDYWARNSSASQSWPEVEVESVESESAKSGISARPDHYDDFKHSTTQPTTEVLCWAHRSWLCILDTPLVCLV